MKLDIELCSLAQSGLYATNLRDLATDMEMDESQRVVQPFFIEKLQGFQQLGARQSELRGIAAALLPFSCSRRSQLDADAEVGLDT